MKGVVADGTEGGKKREGGSWAPARPYSLPAFPQKRLKCLNGGARGVKSLNEGE